MKALWISTSAIGPASRILNREYGGSSGGWIQSEFEAASSFAGLEIFHLAGVPDLPEGDLIIRESSEGTAIGIGMPNIKYGVAPSNKFLNGAKKAVQMVSPDIMHLWGTESVLPYGASVSFSRLPKVTFIQGILGIHQRYLGGYYNSGVNNGLLRSVFEGEKAKIKQRLFKRQAEFEARQLLACGNVITDNTLTKAYCNSLSTDIICHEHYLFPNKRFFESEWTQGTYIFTIFGNAPEKGLHQLLMALSIVKRSFPSVRLCVPGPFNGIVDGHLQDVSSMTMYERSLRDLILKEGLEDNVEFCGKLSPVEMVSMLKGASVFVCPSCMEVHSSSTREALAVGVPVVTSQCGSALELIDHGVDGYIYRYEEYETLAFYVKRMLSDLDHASKIGKAGRDRMHKRLLLGTPSLADVYQNILNTSV